MNVNVNDLKAAFSLAMEQAMKLIVADDAPAVPAKKPAPADVAAKRLKSLEKARAAKRAKAQAKPEPVAEKPATPRKAKKGRKAKAEYVKPTNDGWDVTAHTTKRGKAGKIVRVGPFSMFIEDGDKAKRAAAIAAINGIFRTEEIKKVAAKF